MALLNTVAASATARHLGPLRTTSVDRAAALVHGYAVGSIWAGGLLIVAAAVAGALINTDNRTPAPTTAVERG